jgi:hypothetical protein
LAGTKPLPDKNNATWGILGGKFGMLAARLFHCITSKLSNFILLLLLRKICIAKKNDSKKLYFE